MFLGVRQWRAAASKAALAAQLESSDFSLIVLVEFPVYSILRFRFGRSEFHPFEQIKEGAMRIEKSKDARAFVLE
ncbi:hypothetical protein GW17_00034508 [Ensete ventricosum]|nr:hypothetical protein GW17_00034508 [Ensete ventricosum]RZS00833.1 hypothetical protein BHM03_00030601 [Ensete ventricosum]